ncbi:MAG: YqiA/YcfP family alpha/beta fold hydrolase [Kofleriaceae bacterium]
MTWRCLYLHGFASGPSSAKGVAFQRALADDGIAVERLDLRVPSLAHLRLSAIIDHVVATIGASERVVLIGSSLGGLAAARVAERVPAVRALVLLAPAFRIGERWPRRLGADAVAAWRRDGWLAIEDHTTHQPARVDVGFLDDAVVIDAAGDGWPRVTVPTWIAHGTRDDVVEIELARGFCARTPTAGLTELDDGHDLVASLPIILAGARAFLRGVTAST